MIKKTNSEIYDEFQSGLAFNNSIDLENTVATNFDFYNDNQWRGLELEVLQQPVFNMIKPAVNYYIAQLVSDDVGIDVSLDNVSINDADAVRESEFLAKVIQKSLYDVLDNTKSAWKNRQLVKNMVIDGDMCLYSYFDNSKDNGANSVAGEIKTEIIENINVFFGDPTTDDVESQPFIILRQRLILDYVKEMAKAGGYDPDEVIADNNDLYSTHENYESYTDQLYVDVLTKFFREDGTIHVIKCCKSSMLLDEVDLEYTHYPIAYCSWERNRNSYHGFSPVTGMITDQIMFNKLYALFYQERKGNAFPKIIFDSTRLKDGYNPLTTKAVAIKGDPTNAIFTAFKPPDASGQIMQLLGDMATRLKECAGVFDAAVGNVNPDNTSAIIATQKAASMPLDLQRLDFYNFMESNIYIWLDMIQTCYGVRHVAVNETIEGKEVSVGVSFDFDTLRSISCSLNISVGASAYWSELMQVQTTDNLFSKGIITDPMTYLESLPDGYVKNRQQIIDKLNEMQAKQAEQASQGMQAPPAMGGMNEALKGVM